ncbi:MAG: hypothetical protein A2622_11470 [Bdellovibrionales bacterium RIFCSPHIGHO2_01_FULL_40_29]|nr:MAG: hypothetical protein A2622_11470 [Bdellovibrionales bacterium RIFCSPHIGHO2_01_FULL_40_29]OFZ34567.1 MAG: hypothetical protein A3D17_01735 [Bdellovibrionales bacterium RIFCSPHIGHO2_02_FULL_40_15]
MEPKDLDVIELDLSARMELAQLYHRLGERFPNYFNWSSETALQEFEKSKTFLVREAARIAAFITFREYDDRLEIMAIGTNPDFFMRGYGSRTLSFLQNFAMRRGLPILLEVHENNQSAVKFYKKNGFQVLGARKSYYSDGGTALVMKYL